MKEKTVSIGPFDLGVLDVLEKFSNHHLMLRYLPKLDVDYLFYSFMLQSGATHFQLIKNKKEERPISNFLLGRTSFSSMAKWNNIYDIVHGPFKAALPHAKLPWDEGYIRGKSRKFLPIFLLEQFLTSLCFAMDRNTSAITLYGIPKINSLKGLLPPELLIPIKNFLFMIESEQIKLPLPRSNITKENFEILIDIISSKSFSEYSLQQWQLESSVISSKTALNKVRNTGREIFRRNVRFLGLRQTAISLLPVTAKIIDVVLGRLPGTLAEYSARQAEKFLNDQRRIVVYDASAIYELVIDRIVSISKFSKK